MTKYFVFFILIYINSLSYSKGSDTLLHHSHAASYPSYLDLKDSLTSPKASASALQKSSPLPYTLSYDLVGAIQDSLKVSAEKYFSYASGHPWIENMQSWLEIYKRRLDHYSLFARIAHILLPRFLLTKTRFIYDRLFPFYSKENHPGHLAWVVENPYKIDTSEWDTRLSLAMGEALYGLSLEKRLKTRERITETTKEVFLNLHQEKGARIPHITHRTWITGTQPPSEAPKKRVEVYIKSLKKLSGTDWEHNFWCINPDDIPETVKTLKESGVPINIRKLEEIFPLMKAKHVFDAYYQDKQFCFANDVARQSIVYLYGGIYADLGTLFLHDLTPYADAYDYMFTAMIYGFLDQSFFGYKKNDPIIKEHLNTLDTLYKLPSHVKSLTKTPKERQCWHTPPHLMVYIDQFSKPGDRFLFVPEGLSSLITIDHAGSWMGRETCGNKIVYESELDILSVVP